MKIAITGARDFCDVITVVKALDATCDEFLLKRNYGEDISLLIGDCPTGADSMATYHWRKHYGIPEVFRADWEKLGPAAGPTRNKQMIDAGPDLLLAFTKPCMRRYCPRKLGPHPSHGTHSTIEFANRAGIETKFFAESFPENYFEGSIYHENYLKILANAAGVYYILESNIAKPITPH